MIRVAVVQMCANGTKEQNLAKLRELFAKAVAGRDGLDVVCFPEYCYYAPCNATEAQAAAEDVPGVFSEAMSELAKQYHVNVMTGTFVKRGSAGKIKNTALFINREGKLLAQYSKMHLMDAVGYKESSYAEGGNEMCVFDTDFGRVGMMVCYDMRFPELARSMVMKGANILFVPSDFPSGSPLPPRTDHWDLLTRSTALLNLTYVVAPNQYGPLPEDNPFVRRRFLRGA